MILTNQDVYFHATEYQVITYVNRRATGTRAWSYHISIPNHLLNRRWDTIQYKIWEVIYYTPIGLSTPMMKDHTMFN